MLRIKIQQSFNSKKLIDNMHMYVCACIYVKQVMMMIMIMQGSDGGVQLYWGIAADGSVVISDDLDVIKEGCAKSYAPFPTGM